MNWGGNMRYRIILVLLLGILISCATRKATLDMYVDPNYGTGQIHSVAVFPIRNAKFAPSEARQINRKISTFINRQNSEIEILGAAESIEKLNEADMADEWARFLDNYTSSGVPNVNSLKDFGGILGVDAIIQGEVVNIFQQDGRYGSNKGTTRVTVRFSMLGTQEGKVLWEASSDGIAGTATTVQSAPPIIDAVNLAMEKILKNMPL
jgi:hypothetical protein